MYSVRPSNRSVRKQTTTTTCGNNTGRNFTRTRFGSTRPFAFVGRAQIRSQRGRREYPQALGDGQL